MLPQRRRFEKRTLVILFLLFGGSESSSASDAAGDSAVQRLSWLQGCWRGTQGGVDSEEQWSGTEGGGLLGMHKDVRAGRMISFEFFRVAATSRDSVCYFASPKGRPATPFWAVEWGDKRVVFENRRHDFPQRILYWLDERGRLHARTEGTWNGKEASEEWVWTKRPAP